MSRGPSAAAAAPSGLRPPSGFPVRDPLSLSSDPLDPLSSSLHARVNLGNGTVSSATASAAAEVEVEAAARPPAASGPARSRMAELVTKNLARHLPLEYDGGPPKEWRARFTLQTALASKVFEGMGATKKDAREAACALALEWYDDQGAPSPDVGAATQMTALPRLTSLRQDDEWAWKANKLTEDRAPQASSKPPAKPLESAARTMTPPIEASGPPPRSLSAPPMVADVPAFVASSSAGAAVAAAAPPAAAAAAAAATFQQKRLKTDPNTSTFKVLTYNVLSDSLAKSTWFPHRSATELSWPMRSAVLKREIMEIDADVVCLQEVQAVHGPAHTKGPDHHCAWFDGWLRKECGMTGAFGSRTSSTGTQPPGVQLGNALYWKESRFTPVRVSACIALLKTVSESCTGKDMKLRYATGDARKTVATLAALECRVTKRVFLFVTTHLPAPRGDQDAQAILEQTIHMVALVKEIAKFCTQVKNRTVDAVILAGDLNCLPGKNICELVERGRLDAATVRDLLTKADQTKAPFMQGDGSLVCDSITLSHGEEDAMDPTDCFFWSAMKRALGGREPVTTNHTPTFTGCLDFCYVASSSKLVWEVEAEDPSASIDMERFLPDPEKGHGSDHIPLVVSLTVHFPNTEVEAPVFILSPAPSPPPLTPTRSSDTEAETGKR